MPYHPIIIHSGHHGHHADPKAVMAFFIVLLALTSIGLVKGLIAFFKSDCKKSVQRYFDGLIDQSAFVYLSSVLFFMLVGVFIVVVLSFGIYLIL